MAQSPALREKIALARQEVERRRPQSPLTTREKIALARQEVERRRQPPSEQSWIEKAIPLGMRLGSAVGGGVLGGIATWNPLGVYAGGAAGAGLGEALAQRYEQGTGARESYNLPQIAMQTALGGIPMGRALGSTARGITAFRGGQGALMGGGATVATSLAETGELPSWGEVGVGAGLGLGLGGGLGAIEARAAQRATLASVAREAPPSAAPTSAREFARVDPIFDSWHQRRARGVDPAPEAPPRASAEQRATLASVARGESPGAAPLPDPILAEARLPVSAVSRSGTPMADPMAGFDPLHAKFTDPTIRRGVEQVIRENGGFAGERRGVIRTPDLDRFASEVTIDATKVLPKGTALNDAQITAYGRALLRTTSRVNELAARVNSPKATDVDILALQGARAEQEVIAASFASGRTEAGRALSAFNFWNGVLDTGDVNLIRDVVNAPGTRKEAQRIAREVAKLPDDPLVRYRYLQKQKASSIMDKVRSYYYANILSGVKTHERNFMGNVANIASELVVHPIGAGIDAVTSAVTGAPRTMLLDEMPARAAGALAGLERGIRDFAFTMKQGVSPDALSRSLHTGELGKLDIPRVEFAGGGANPFNLPGRFLDASDTFFRSVSKNMELYGLASTAAKNEGLTGQAFLDRVATLRSATTPEGIALRDQAHLFARRSVFQEKPGEFVQKIQELSRMFPPLTFIMPFIKTPANILRQGVEFSPLGAAMPAARQGGRAGRQAQSRVAAGTAAAGVLAYLAATGRLSGRGPSNPAERNALYEKNWEPNSVKIGDKWVSYQLFQPISVQAAIIANLYEQLAESKADEDTIATTVADTMSRSMNSFLNQSFLSGLFDFVEAIQSVDRSAARVAGRTASGFVPLVSLQRQIAQGMDPVIRQPRTVEQNVLTSIPGLSQSVPPRLTRFGEEVTRPGGPLKRMFDPFNISTEVDDPIATELSRLGVNISVPSGRLTMPVQLQDRTGLEEFSLSDAQSTGFRQTQGRAVRQALERVMQSPRYRELSDVERERVIRSVRTQVVGAVRDQARRQLLPGALMPDMAGTPRGVGKQFTSGPFEGQTWTVVDGTPQRVS
jgi:hypothetical protein